MKNSPTRSDAKRPESRNNSPRCNLPQGSIVQGHLGDTERRDEADLVWSCWQLFLPVPGTAGRVRIHDALVVYRNPTVGECTCHIG